MAKRFEHISFKKKLRVWREQSARHFLFDTVEKPAVSLVGSWFFVLLVVTITWLTVAYSSGGSIGCDPATANRSEEAIGPIQSLATLAVVIASLLALALAPVIELGFVPWFKRTFLKNETGRINGLDQVTRLLWRVPSLTLSVIDFILVRVVAPSAGACISSPTLRYLTLFIVIFGLSIGSIGLGEVRPHLAVFLAALPIVVVFSIVRRWLWIEADRRQYQLYQENSEKDLRIGFAEDLTDEALVGLATLMLTVPNLLAQLNDAFPNSFCSDAALQYTDWLTFFGGELMKSVPLVDWSEVFNVANGSSIKPSSSFGSQIVFVVRVSLDLVLIAALLEAVSIVGRVVSQREAFFGNPQKVSYLEPFELYRRFRSLTQSNKQDLSSVSSRVTEFPKYDRRALKRIAEPGWTRRDKASESDGKIRRAAHFLYLEQYEFDVDLIQSCAAKDVDPINSLWAFEKLLFHTPGRLKRSDLANSPADLVAHLVCRKLKGTSLEGDLRAMLEYAPRSVKLLSSLALGDLPLMTKVLVKDNTIDGQNKPNRNTQRNGGSGLITISSKLVTVEQYILFALQKRRHQRPGQVYSLSDHTSKQRRIPATGVTYVDARAYCRWLSNITGRRFRLPTEQEWEQVAERSKDELSHLITTQERERSLRENKLPMNDVGIQAMLGLRNQWCSTRFTSDQNELFPGRAVSKRRSTKRRVLKGGAHMQLDPSEVVKWRGSVRGLPSEPKVATPKSKTRIKWEEEKAKRDASLKNVSIRFVEDV